MDLDYKKYSLENLENWMHDAVSSAEASPHEIYSVIRKVVQEQYEYHKEHSQRCLGLLELLSGHRPVQEEKSKYYYDYDRNDLNRKPPLKYNEAVAEGYEMTDDGFWIPPQKDDRVQKWVLPVQQSVIDGIDDYYINFPDDLLEAANLKEGDQVEWFDNEDGSFELRKVNGIK